MAEGIFDIKGAYKIQHEATCLNRRQPMEEEQVRHLFHLFHLYWFRHLVLQPETSPPPPPPQPPPSAVNPTGEPHLPILRLHHCRSNSDSSSSPVSALYLPKLDTILSSKESNSSDTEIYPSNPPNPSKVENFRVSKKKKNKKGSKSLTELEYEELRGFMDLGFVFPKDDIDSELVSILPGLQSWAGKDGGGELRTEADVPRPYLSESWSSVDGGKEDGVLLKGWRIPAAGDGVDMKDHLRCWAHAVASMVI